MRERGTYIFYISYTYISVEGYIYIYVYILVYKYKHGYLNNRHRLYIRYVTIYFAKLTKVYLVKQVRNCVTYYIIYKKMYIGTDVTKNGSFIRL